MANPEHLRILLQDVAAWNAWRCQNEGIRPDLTRANLHGAALHEAVLRGAGLSGAELITTHFFDARLGGANLSRARLAGAVLISADLTSANLSYGTLFETVFGDTNLTDVRGLETCRHYGRSTLDYRTLAKSGPLPLAFLRGCGLKDWEIEATKLYQPGLSPTQINDIVYRIYSLRADPGTGSV